MDFLGLNPGQFESFTLILVRISIVLFMFPFFGGVMVPNTVKAGLALMITTLGFTLFGESLRDVIDPRLSGTRE